VNRFRGDPQLFSGGVSFLEDRLRIPCLGIFPFEPEIRLDEEDSVSIPKTGSNSGADIAVVRFPRISNFTDFRLFSNIEWVDEPVQRNFQAVFLPGTKNTIEDLQWLREGGLCEWLVEQHKRGARIVGICGGYQMLGMEIADPDHLESSAKSVDGLGLLPVRTVLHSPKVTRVVQASIAGGQEFAAYEIHMGRTEALESVVPFARLADGSPEGAQVDGVVGTYLHGIFEHPEVVRRTLGLDVPAIPEKYEMYDLLADWLIAHSNPHVLEDLLS
jgi:adenosylcobyric acid synthase